MLADEEISRTPLVFGMSLVFRVSQVFDFFQPLEGGDALENSEKSRVSRFLEVVKEHELEALAGEKVGLAGGQRGEDPVFTGVPKSHQV